MRISEEIKKIIAEGYDEGNAEAKLCQDIVLRQIANSNLGRNCTIKGGVVMRSISNNVRRATQDLDIDFIRYSLEDNSIRDFIKKLNSNEVTIDIVGQIEELKQQDYHGKRVYIEIKDSTGEILESKIDFGVHRKMNVQQEEYCFDIGFDNKGASLLINSKEQMFTEKLRSILKFGFFSTRYKDVYDMYYLLDKLDMQVLMDCIDSYIIVDSGMKENTYDEVASRVEATFNSPKYLKRLETSKANWLELSNEVVLSKIVEELKKLEAIADMVEVKEVTKDKSAKSHKNAKELFDDLDKE